MCPARYRAGGSLLHCPSTLTDTESAIRAIRFRVGGIFLLHCPGSRLRRPLTGILPCEARTFLTCSFRITRFAAAIICPACHAVLYTKKTKKSNDEDRRDGVNLLTVEADESVPTKDDRSFSRASSSGRTRSSVPSVRLPLSGIRTVRIWLDASGNDLALTSELLGHTSTDVTRRAYARTTEQRMEAATGLVGFPSDTPRK